MYSVDASQPGVTEGKTVTSFDGSAVTQYPDYASWFNANETVNGLKFLSIGNVEGGLPGAGGFVGRIAAVAFIPRALSQQQAAQLTGERWGQAPQLLYAAENIVVETPSQAVELEQTLAGRIAALDEMTVIVKFKNTNTGVGSLFSVSDPHRPRRIFISTRTTTGWALNTGIGTTPSMRRPARYMPESGARWPFQRGAIQGTACLPTALLGPRWKKRGAASA